MTSVRPWPARPDQSWSRQTLALAGDEADRAGILAVRQRQARLRGAAGCGGDAGNDLDRHARLTRGVDLLAAAAEDERVAALEPHDAACRRSVSRDQERVDRLLRHRVAAALLGDGDTLRPRRDSAARRADQPVMNDDIGDPERLDSARTVSSPGSPGPAPTRMTRPRAVGLRSVAIAVTMALVSASGNAAMLGRAEGRLVAAHQPCNWWPRASVQINAARRTNPPTRNNSGPVRQRESDFSRHERLPPQKSGLTTHPSGRCRCSRGSVPPSLLTTG